MEKAMGVVVMAAMGVVVMAVIVVVANQPPRARR